MIKYYTYEVPDRGFRIETDDELKLRIMDWLKNNESRDEKKEEACELIRGFMFPVQRMIMPLKENEICVLKPQGILLNEEFYNDCEKELQDK